MHLEYLQAKLHMAVVTEANPDYHGSITIDQDLMDCGGIDPRTPRRSSSPTPPTAPGSRPT